MSDFRRGSASPSLRNVWTVLTVAHEGGVKRASLRLSLSQPAITRALQQTEAVLGVDLFHRYPTGTVPTRFGKIFVRRAERLFEHLIATERQIRREAPPSKDAPRPVPLHRKLGMRHLRTIVEVADCGSVTFAAQRLGVSQPAAQRSLLETERAVGTSLFERRYRQLVPNRYGDIFVQGAKLALGELRFAREDLAAEQGQLAGQVLIGSLPLLRARILPKTIQAVTERHPELRFSLIEGPYSTLLSALRQGDIDILVGALRAPPPVDDVTEESLMLSQMAIVSRPGHPLAGRDRIEIADLARYGWVATRQGNPTRGNFDSLFEKAGLAPPTDIVESGSHCLLRALLVDSDRLSIISRQQIHYEEAAGMLTVLPVDLSWCQRPVGITLRKNSALPPGAQVFLESLRETITALNNAPSEDAP